MPRTSTTSSTGIPITSTRRSPTASASWLTGWSLLGHADVDLVDKGSQLKNVETGQFIALLDGRTLPIKFRIEEGALALPFVQVLAVKDGAHDGNPHFFFLPPLVPDPNATGVFDGSRFVEMHIVEQRGADGWCRGPGEDFQTNGTAAGVIGVNSDKEYYVANWDTNKSYLAAGKVYRINVKAAGWPMGYLDLELTSDWRGQALPITFRIEQGALPGGIPGGGTACSI